MPLKYRLTKLSKSQKQSIINHRNSTIKGNHILSIYLIIDDNEPEALPFATALAESHFETVLIRKAPIGLKNIPAEAEVACYLSDAQLRHILPLALEKQWCLQILAHNQATNACIGFASNTQKLLPTEHSKTIQQHILYCNDTPVLNRIKMGKTFVFQSNFTDTSFLAALKHLRQNSRSAFSMTPTALSITTENSGETKVAASALYSVLHTTGTPFSKAFEQSNIQYTGMLNLFIISPRSLLELLRFIVSGLYKTHSTPPTFIGVLRSKHIDIHSQQELTINLDHETLKTNTLQLKLSEEKLKMRVALTSPLANLTHAEKEIRKLKNVPQGDEAIHEMAHRPLPLIAHAATEEFKELYQQLRSYANPSTTFTVFILLSTCLATIGLLSNSSPVIIGAMLIAPLMDPIIALSMGIARQDEKLVLPSVKKLTSGVTIALAGACALTFSLPVELMTEEIRARTNPNVLDLGVAIISGIVGAYSQARASSARGLAGVAIAVALVPPIAVTGIGIANGSFSVIVGSFLLFLTNLAGILFSGAITYLMLGFAPFKRAKAGLFKSLTAVLLVSLPLLYSFNQLIQQAEIKEKIQQIDLKNITINSIEIVSLNQPLELRIELMNKQLLTDKDLITVKASIEQTLSTEITLQISTITRF